jgi:hypothetical protein
MCSLIIAFFCLRWLADFKSCAAGEKKEYKKEKEKKRTTSNSAPSGFVRC